MKLSKYLLALTMLVSGPTFAGYMNTAIVMSDGTPLRAAADAANDGYHSLNDPFLTSGSLSFAIDARSNTAALYELGNQLCQNYGKSINVKLKLAKVRFPLQQGKSAVGHSGSVRIESTSAGLVAKLVPASTEELVSISCDRTW